MRRAMSCVLVLLGGCSSALAQTSPSESSLVQAAQKRQDLVKSVRCVYAVKETMFAGSKSEMLGSVMDRLSKSHGTSQNGKTFPETDVTFESSNVLVVSGDMARFEEVQPMFDLVTKQFNRTVFVSSDNGGIKKSMFYDERQSPKQATGVLDNLTRPYFRRITVAPLTASIRGVHPTLTAYHMKSFSPTKATLTVRGIRCQEYLSKESAKSYFRLWVDSEREKVIVRIENIKNAHVEEVIDIDYDRLAEPSIWVPGKWTVKVFGKNGRILVQSECTVRELEINRRDYSPSDIDISFPEGIRVSDNRNSKEYRSASDGSLLLADARGNLTGGSVPMPGQTSFVRHYALIITLTLTVVSFGLLMFLYTRRRKWRQLSNGGT